MCGEPTMDASERAIVVFPAPVVPTTETRLTGHDDILAHTP